MNLLILKGFNNYFNRKIKKYTDTADYVSNSALSYTFSSINFNPNDGVTTELIIGSENQKETDNKVLQWEFEGTPDYLVCYESEFIHNENESVTEIKHIKSRWFVLECIRTRAGQYQLALKRDVLADHLEQILTNPCFVEKGYVAPNNPLIFNEEGVSFNEVKKNEQMLTDETGIPWIVIYMAQNFPSAELDNPYMLGTAPNKYLAVTGKTTIDTGTAIRYTELPWIGEGGGIEPLSPNTAIPSGYIRRIPGQGSINIAPIIGGYVDMPGVGRYINSPLVLAWIYEYKNSSWGSPLKGTFRAGSNEESGLFTFKVLKRKDIGLTPGDTTVRWGESNDGNAVCSFGALNNYSGDSFYNHNKEAAQMLQNLASDLPSSNVQLRTYLNTKKVSFEGNATHSAVPGQSNMQAFVGGPQSFLNTNEILNYNGKIVTNDGTNYYKIKITIQNRYSRPIDSFQMINGKIGMSSPNNLTNILWSGVNQVIPDNYTWNKNSANNSVLTFFEHTWFDIQYIPVATETIRCKIMQPESTDRIHANEVAYDMICLPYGAIKFKVSQGGVIYDKISSAPASLGIARAIAAASGSALYDMQLLPYCPYRAAAEEYGERLKDYSEYLEVIESGGTWVGPIPPEPYIDITNTASQKLLTGCWFKASTVNISNEDPNATGWPNNTSGHTKDFVDPENKNAVTFGLWCPSIHGTFDIIHNVDVPEQDSTEYKVFNACKKFRLVSPNYTSAFEFEPLKNLGVTVFNVDYTYKPYNPYIHIAPRFNADGLYGVDTNDNRGLILQGDFSVGYYSDKWAEYQINNANYANIFNREMQNLKKNQNLEIQQHAMAGGFDAVANTFGAARAGSNTGNPIADALMGTAMLGKGFQGQLIGAAADAYFMGKSMAEARSFKKDMYNLQLGTIKALPYSLAKSDALTENFKYFPFIEEFESTEIEKEIFRQKLKYDGMTINAIGTLAEYTPETYEIQRLKGQLIMQDNLVDDFQVAEDIYKEVDKGFYLVDKGE